MATLEKRGSSFRIVFWIAGQRYSRSLKTRNEREAFAAQVRLEDNLRRYDLGLLSPPEGSDLAAFLLSDGRETSKPERPALRTLGDLFDAYFRSLPEGGLETTTLAGMRLHEQHLRRHLGATLPLLSLQALELQGYVERRSKEPGLRGRNVSPATIKKDLITLKTAWNWAIHMGHLRRPFPNRGLRFGKISEKPPFQTVAEIEKRIAKGGLSLAEEADLWDCAFLTLADIEELLGRVQNAASQPFVYPLFVFAAHTGARRSEMLRSEITDLDFAASSVLIHEKKRVRGKLSTRRVPMSPLLRQVMADWLKAHPGGKHTFSQGSGVVCSKTPRRMPQPVTTDEAHDHFKRTLRGSRFQRLRGWHVFRHSFCSNAAASGIDQRLINAWVGHQTEEMVKRYRHLLPDQQQEAICQVFGSQPTID